MDGVKLKQRYCQASRGLNRRSGLSGKAGEVEGRGNHSATDQLQVPGSTVRPWTEVR